MKNFKTLSGLPIVAMLFLILTACATKANFVAENNSGPAVMILEGEKASPLPTSQDVMSTTFGQYSFTVSDGKNEVAGLLPLKVRPVRIVMDSLFFAPALFFNIQGACDSYIFNMLTGVVLCEDNGQQIPVQATRTALQP